MQYIVNISAINGDIVPLLAVAGAMARHDATAGGTPYHAPMFNGRLTGHILALLEEVRSGRLEVCDAFGSRIAVDPTIEATGHFGYAQRYVNEPDWKKLRRDTPPVDLDWETLHRDWENQRDPDSVEPNWEKLRTEFEKLRDASPGQPGWKKLCKFWVNLRKCLSPVEPVGVWNFTHINFGPTEPDKSRPMIGWKTKLKLLNEWAEKRGDSFVISHEGIGWYDERGYVVPPHQQEAQQPKISDGIPKLNTQKAERQIKGPVPDAAEIVPDKWYSTHLAARFLGVAQKYLQNDLIPLRKLKAKKINGRWYINGHTIRDYRESMDPGS